MADPTPQELRDALATWAQQNGILADTASGNLVGVSGDAGILPFEDEFATYFRTRKIVRITYQEPANALDNTILTLFSKLPIAKTKAESMVSAFNREFGSKGIILRIDASKPFKIDNTVLAYGQFEPVRQTDDGMICCGSSVGIGNQRNAGTLAALAVKKGAKGNGPIYGLSCNHVVGGCSTGRPGTPIVVPGIQDVSTEHSEIWVIGDHASVARMSQGLPSVTDITDNHDLACFTIRENAPVSSMQGAGDDAYDTPTRIVAKVRAGLPVKKWGRSTGFTQSRVDNVVTDGEPVEYDLTSYYGPMNSQRFRGTVYYGQIFEVPATNEGPFSLSGDSGSLVVTNEPGKKERAVGIVVAGDASKSIVLPIQAALRNLNLVLLSGHNL